MVGEPLRIQATIERHHPETPRFVVVPASAVARWRLDGTTVVEGTIAGTPLGRRTLKRWDDERWFVDLPEGVCRAAGVDVGDPVELEIRTASTELPTELTSLLATSSRARELWDGLNASRRRMIREHVLDAKRPETRERRALCALGMEEAP